MSGTAALSWFPRAFAFVVGVEGTFGCDAADLGNWTGGAVGRGLLRGTKYGISAASYPLVDIENLTLEDAQAIYLGQFWRPLGLDDLPYSVAVVLFDAAVNSGRSASVSWLQVAVGAGRDGVMGPQTEAATNAFLQHNGVDALRLALLVARLIFMSDLPTWKTFRRGWVARLFQLAFDTNSNPQGQS